MLPAVAGVVEPEAVELHCQVVLGPAAVHAVAPGGPVRDGSGGRRSRGAARRSVDSSRDRLTLASPLMTARSLAAPLAFGPAPKTSPPAAVSCGSARRPHGRPEPARRWSAIPRHRPAWPGRSGWGCRARWRSASGPSPPAADTPGTRRSPGEITSAGGGSPFASPYRRPPRSPPRKAACATGANGGQVGGVRARRAVADPEDAAVDGSSAPEASRSSISCPVSPAASSSRRVATPCARAAMRAILAPLSWILPATTGSSQDGARIRPLRSPLPAPAAGSPPPRPTPRPRSPASAPARRSAPRPAGRRCW